MEWYESSYLPPLSFKDAPYLHHGEHHDVVRAAVDVTFLHDDFTCGHAAVGVTQVDFLEVRGTDDLIVRRDDGPGPWEQVRDRHVNIFGVLVIHTLGCRALI